MSERISEATSGDYFDRARSVAAAFMIATAAAAILGSFLDWVTIKPPERVPPQEADRLATFSGIEANDGWIVIVAAVMMILFTISLVVRKSSPWAWGSFVAATVIGGVAIADYRGIEQIFYDEMERIGDPSPGLGLMLVAAGGIFGMIASAVGVAASPRRD